MAVDPTPVLRVFEKDSLRHERSLDCPGLSANFLSFTNAEKTPNFSDRCYDSTGQTVGFVAYQTARERPSFYPR